jgi:hypothetical protein
MADELAKDWDPYDGFNRASIVMASRKPYRPNIRAEDLLTPSGLGNFRMAGMCVVMAICMVLLYIWPVLFVVNLAVPMTGLLFSSILGTFAFAFFLFLYFAGTRETRRDRELAARL